MVFYLKTIGVCQIINWWLIFENKAKINIGGKFELKSLVILLRLYLKFFFFILRFIVIIIQRNFFFFMKNYRFRGCSSFRFYRFRFLIFKGCSLSDRFILSSVKVARWKKPLCINCQHKQIWIFLFCDSCVYLFKNCPPQFLSHWELAEPLFCSEQLSCLPYKDQNKGPTLGSLIGKFKFAVWW